MYRKAFFWWTDDVPVTRSDRETEEEEESSKGEKEEESSKGEEEEEESSKGEKEEKQNRERSSCSAGKSWFTGGEVVGMETRIVAGTEERCCIGDQDRMRERKKKMKILQLAVNALWRIF
jgi:DNA mismatch repair ATPase MutL